MAFGDDSSFNFYRTLQDAPFRQADKFFRAELQDLNGSGIDGEVLAFFDDETDQLTLIVVADGVEANQVHLMHVHGFTDGRDAKIPTLAADADGDGFIELAEGLPDYGGILLNVRLNHDDGTGGDNGHAHGGSFEGFPLAPDGSIRFMETFQLPKDMLNAQANLQNYHFVIHGMSVGAGPGAGSPGEINGQAGFKLVLPVAIGDFEQISRGQAFRELTEARVDALREGIEDSVFALTGRFSSHFDIFA